MSKILIFPSNNVPGLTAIITSLGHTPVYKDPSLITPSSIVSEGPPGVDGVLMILFTVVDSSPSVIATIKTLNELGYIFSVGRTNSGVNSYTSILYNLKLTNSPEQQISTDFKFNQNSELLSLTTKEKISIYLYATFAHNGISSFSPEILLADSLEKSNAFYFKSNTTASDMYVYKNPLFYLGFLWDIPSDENLRLILKSLFFDIFSFAAEVNLPNLIVEGTVKDTSDKGLVRELALYSSSTKALLKTTTSDETGYYKFLLKKSDPVFIVYVPLGTEKPDVHFNITPKEIT